MKAIRRAKLTDKDKETKGSMTSLARPGSPSQKVGAGVTAGQLGPDGQPLAPGAVPGGGVNGGLGDANLDSQLDWLPPKTLMKPPGQLQLADRDLDEELTRILNANNPHAPQNIARYNNKERTYKASPYTEHMVVHFDFEGYLQYKGAPESSTSAAAAAAAAVAAAAAATQAPGGEDGASAPAEGESSAHASVGTDPEPAPVAAPPVLDEKAKAAKAVARNQFNFSERATQSVNNPQRHRFTNTEPPPHRTFTAAVNQWSIYDAYIEDTHAKEKAVKEKSKAAGATAKNHKEDDTRLNQLQAADAQQHGSDDIRSNNEFRKRLSIVERMANQNTFDEITQDFKYWDDAADEYRETKEGSLLPLWHFLFEKEKKKHVTAVCWSPVMSDFFAAGFGSYDFTRQGPGLICCFSLKNTSYPEFVFHTDSGVLCLDFHPQKPNLIAVGMHDGVTAVYDLRKKTAENPVFKSTAKLGRHIDAVWQVSWQPDDLDGNSNFYSISSDGQVMQATLLKNELVCSEVLQLRPPNVNELEASDSERLLLSGSCFDFHKTNDHIFVVGTEEGKLMKCSKDYNSEYLQTYEGHAMSVYKVCYNKFYTDVFLTASGDWTVRLWDHNTGKPALMFDLNCPVSDVAWAPYSSTVFAAVTADGKVYVFDMEINKFDPICVQQVTRKAKLTHISFNPFEPIIVVGDDRGNMISLKLSPNLRKMGRGGQKATVEEQKDRLERIVLLSTGRTLA
ncbi:hypothetical protein RI367_006179 [Sorochytrium milnesiophthora]